MLYVVIFLYVCYLVDVTQKVFIESKKGILQIISIKFVLTASKYSNLRMSELRMEGETGGIFSVFPFHLLEVSDGTSFPLALATTCLMLFVLPLAV